MPKSSSLGKTVPSGSVARKTFSGLRSRWAMPLAWAASRARASARRIGIASASGIRPIDSRYSSSGSPSRYSIT